ncbi:MAG: hypothetical protein WC263_05335 [Candidatus Micrarchaeia archaeon]|jgi:hypothetical protein
MYIKHMVSRRYPEAVPVSFARKEFEARLLGGNGVPAVSGAAKKARHKASALASKVRLRYFGSSYSMTAKYSPRQEDGRTLDKALQECHCALKAHLKALPALEGTRQHFGARVEIAELYSKYAKLSTQKFKKAAKWDAGAVYPGFEGDEKADAFAWLIRSHRCNERAIYHLAAAASIREAGKSSHLSEPLPERLSWAYEYAKDSARGLIRYNDGMADAADMAVLIEKYHNYNTMRHNHLSHSARLR